MPKGIYRHGARQLSIDPMQEIEVECSRYTLRIVICRQQNIPILDPIDAYQ
jgi:hypothetical protein